MMGTRIDLSQLTPGETQAVLERYEALVEAMQAANNTLIAKLADCPGTTNDHVDILNDWSAFNNCLHAAHALELERAGAALN